MSGVCSLGSENNCKMMESKSSLNAACSLLPMCFYPVGDCLVEIYKGHGQLLF
jgi:hypothetical protein